MPTLPHPPRSYPTWPRTALRLLILNLLVVCGALLTARAYWGPFDFLIRVDSPDRLQRTFAACGLLLLALNLRRNPSPLPPSPLRTWQLLAASAVTLLAWTRHWGLTPDLALHALSVALLAWLGTLWFGHGLLASAMATLYGLHPGHALPDMDVTHRAALCLVLLGLAAFLWHADRRHRLAAVVVLIAGAAALWLDRSTWPYPLALLALSVARGALLVALASLSTWALAWPLPVRLPNSGSQSFAHMLGSGLLFPVPWEAKLRLYLPVAVGIGVRGYIRSVRAALPWRELTSAAGILLAFCLPAALSAWTRQGASLTLCMVAALALLLGVCLRHLRSGYARWTTVVSLLYFESVLLWHHLATR